MPTKLLFRAFPCRPGVPTGRLSKYLAILTLSLAALLGTGLLAGCGRSETTAHAKAQKYHCPMHPNYVSDRPGDCPICNMKLVPIKDEAAPAENKTAMPMPETSAHADMESTVPGRIAVMISSEKQQLIGVRYSTVEKRDLSVPVRIVATVEHDETRFAKIAPRFSGWVQDLKINFTGQQVEKGQPLLTVYSPDLLSAENEYLIAYQRVRELKDNPNDTQAQSAQRLLESARRKLTLWQIADEEIHTIETTGKPLDAVILRSPVSGHVITKNIVAGKAFAAGETLYEIGDLSHLWLRAYVYEYEMPLVKVGEKAHITFPYLGNKTYESTVSFFYPHIEQQTRRAEIRIELNNPNHELRPQMWANVELDASYGETLAVPASAVIDTGERYIAFVKGSEDHLEPREVKIGAQTDDYYQVLGGLKEGEQVVTRALFLVDSESQLKAAIAGMGGMEGHQH